MRLLILTLQKYLSDNRRGLLIKMGSSILAWIFMGFIMALSGMGGGRGEVGLLFCAMSLAACVFTAQIFTEMHSPAGRISTLMLPSTTADKFLARWIVAVPMCLIFLCGCFWIAEITRVTLWPLFNHYGHTHLLRPGETFFGAGELLSVISATLFIQSIFLFGAIAWPRFSFLKTVILFWTGWAILLICLIAFIPENSHIAYSGDFFGSELNKELIVTCCTSLSTLFFYWLAYLRLRESDLADRLI